MNKNDLIYQEKDCGASVEKYERRTRALVLTYKCNLDCTYCYVPFKSDRVMSLEVAKKAIYDTFKSKEGMEFEGVEIQFLGGEPLCAFERLKEISEWMWQQSWSKPYILFATTNGTMLNEEMKDWFTKNKDRFVLGLSYDGTDKMQDINRTSSSGKVDMEFFYKTWPKQPLKMTISEETVKDLAEGVIHLTEKGFKINANAAYSDSDWKNESIYEYSNQLEKLVNYYIANPEKERVSFLKFDPCNLLKHDMIVQNKYCGAGGAFDIADVDGRLYPCHLFSPLVLLRAELERLHNIDFKEEAQFADKRCSKCVLKNICPTCAGMNFKTTGNTSLRDATHCKIFILDVMANCKLQTRLLCNKSEVTEEDKERAFVIKKINDILVKQFGKK